MRKRMNVRAWLVGLAAALVVAVAAGPTVAGTVYSWTTEEGTTAFTDDPKRIPARYRSSARQRELGPLKDYSRYSESQVVYEASAPARTARPVDRLPAVSAPPPGNPGGVLYGVGLGPAVNDQVTFPVGESNEPFTTTRKRVRSRKSIATQEMTVTKRGDEVISVRLGPRNQRKITEEVIDQ